MRSGEAAARLQEVLPAPSSARLMAEGASLTEDADADAALVLEGTG